VFNYCEQHFKLQAAFILVSDSRAFVKERALSHSLTLWHLQSHIFSDNVIGDSHSIYVRTDIAGPPVAGVYIIW